VLRRHLPIYVVISAGLSGVVAWFAAEPVDEAAAWRILRVAVSGSGRWIAVGAASGWIGIIDQTQPDSPQRFRGGAGKLRDLRFSKDEQWLIVANDALARHKVQSLGSLEPLEPGDNRGEPQTSAEWAAEHTSNVASGTGSVVVFGNAAGSIEVHDVRTREMLRRFTFR
jgi:hypothetical protein